MLDDGHPAVAVANPLRGVRSDADYLSTVVSAIESDIVLVGHSAPDRAAVMAVT